MADDCDAILEVRRIVRFRPPPNSIIRVICWHGVDQVEFAVANLDIKMIRQRTQKMYDPVSLSGRTYIEQLAISIASTVLLP